VALAEKSTVGTPEWIGDADGASPLRRLVAPLAVGGVISAGLRLQVAGPRAAPIDRPFYDLRAVLLATIAGQTYHLGRLEFDPAGDPPHHTNPLSARGMAPPSVTGPHCHGFAINAQIGLHCLEPAQNLPLALPESREFRRYDEVLDTIGTRFLIPGFWTEDPGWLLLLT